MKIILKKMFFLILLISLTLIGTACSNKEAKWLTGINPPTANIGKNEDMYLNRHSGDLYYKENNQWKKIANILGFQNDNQNGEVSLTSAKLINNELIFVFDHQEVNVGANSPASNYTISLVDGDLYVTLESMYENLDSYAYGGLSFRELFVDNNFLKTGNLLEDDDLSSWTVYAGNPTTTVSNYHTAPTSLNVSGSSSQQLKMTLTAEDKGKLFLASQVKIVSYTAGFAGLFTLASGTNNTKGMKSGITNGFETAAQLVNYSSGALSICMGSGNSANLTGFVDSAVALNLSKLFGEKTPSLDTMIKLYEVFLKLYNGESNIMIKNSFTTNAIDEEISRDTALRAFYGKMALKAQKLGVNISSYSISDAIGFTPFISIQDMVRIAIHATAYDELAKVWNNPSYTATTLGVKKTFTVSSTVVSASNSHYLTDHYFVLGGKTGTLSNVANLLTVVEGPNGAIFVGMVSSNAKDTASDNRFTKAKILFDIASLKYSNPQADTSALEASLTADRACVVVLPPNGNILSYSTYDWFGANSKYHLYSRNGTEKMYVASVWKILTAITALDYIDNLDARITVDVLDLSASTPAFTGGEIMTYRNALYFMMLPSSNTTCNTIARFIGEKIIREGL